MEEDRQQFERRLMREWFDRPQPPERMFEGVVSVPEFVDMWDAEKFIAGLAADDTTGVDVIAPDTGEVLLDAGQPAGESYYHPADQAKREKRSEQREIEIYISGVDDEEITSDFESKYDVEMGLLRDFAEGDPNELEAIGYSVDLSIPARIRRPDGGTITQNDWDNADEYLEVFGRILNSMQPAHVELDASWSGETVLEVSPMFMS